MSEWRQRTVAENQASNAAADVEMSQYVADRTRVNEDKIKQDDEIIQQFGDYTYGWHDTDFAGEAAKKGIEAAKIGIEATEVKVSSCQKGQSVIDLFRFCNNGHAPLSG